MKYKYLVKLKDGKASKGVIESQNRETAIEALSKGGLTPISVTEISEAQNFFKNINEKTTFIPFKEKVLITRQLSTLISAGIPISQAMHILTNQVENKKLKQAIMEIAEDIEGGSLLSKALEKQGKIFSTLVINMVRAGEVGGILDESLDRAASQLEKEHQLASEIRGAMIYPVAILVLTVGVLVFMIIYLIPQMSQIFGSLGSELPPNLKALMNFSEFIKKFGIILVACLVGLIYGFRVLLSKNKNVRYRWHQLLLKTPIFGKIMKKINISRFTRNLSALLSSGVSVIEALEVARDSLGNEVYKRDISEAIEKVQNGSAIADALKDSSYFPSVVCQTIAVGEETGSTDKILIKLTEYYENEVSTLTKGLSDLILPIMMIMIGIVVGLIFYSVIVPLSQISDYIS